MGEIYVKRKKLQLQLNSFDYMYKSLFLFPNKSDTLNLIIALFYHIMICSNAIYVCIILRIFVE